MFFNEKNILKKAIPYFTNVHKSKRLYSLHDFNLKYINWIMNENNKKNKLSFKSVFGDIKEKITKITYYKIKENPAIKQAEIMIQGGMKMGEKVIKEAKPKKVPDLHPELKKFITDQNIRWEQQFEFNHQQNKKWEAQTELNNEIKGFIKDQNKKWDQQIKTNQVVLTSIQEILLRLERIESLPTIKKELSNRNE